MIPSEIREGETRSVQSDHHVHAPEPKKDTTTLHDKDGEDNESTQTDESDLDSNNGDTYTAHPIQMNDDFDMEANEAAGLGDMMLLTQTEPTQTEPMLDTEENGDDDLINRDKGKEEELGDKNVNQLDNMEEETPTEEFEDSTSTISSVEEVDADDDEAGGIFHVSGVGFTEDDDNMSLEEKDTLQSVPIHQPHTTNEIPPTSIGFTENDDMSLEEKHTLTVAPSYQPSTTNESPTSCIGFTEEDDMCIEEKDMSASAPIHQSDAAVESHAAVIKHGNKDIEATVIQKITRGFISRKHFDRIRRSVKVIQRCFLRYRSQLQVKKSRIAATTIQKITRGLISRKQYKCIQRSVKVIQRCFLRYRVELQVKKSRIAATIIQKITRGLISRKQYQCIQRSVKVIQRYYLRYRRKVIETHKSDAYSIYDGPTQTPSSQFLRACDDLVMKIERPTSTTDSQHSTPIRKSQQNYNSNLGRFQYTNDSYYNHGCTESLPTYSETNTDCMSNDSPTRSIETSKEIIAVRSIQKIARGFIWRYRYECNRKAASVIQRRYLRHRMRVQARKATSARIMEIISELRELKKRNLSLESENSKIRKEKDSLGRQVSLLMTTVEEKTSLCANMERHIARIQPVVDAVQKVSSLSGTLTVSSPSSRRILESDSEDELDTKPTKTRKVTRRTDSSTPTKESMKESDTPMSTEKRATRVSDTPASTKKRKATRKSNSPTPTKEATKESDTHASKRVSDIPMSMKKRTTRESDAPTSTKKRATGVSDTPASTKKRKATSKSDSTTPTKKRRATKESDTPTSTKKRAATKSDSITPTKKRKATKEADTPASTKKGATRKTDSPTPTKEATKESNTPASIKKRATRKSDSPTPTKEKTKESDTPASTTAKGISDLLHHRAKKSNRKKTTITPSPGAKQKPSKSKASSPSRQLDFHPLHLTQETSPGYSFRSKSRAIPQLLETSDGIKLPLSGLSFFLSGMAAAVTETITSLGGNVLREVTGENLEHKHVHKKLFFISQPDKRRTHKYLLACALGVPMIHYRWVYELKRRWKEYRDGKGIEKKPSVYDSHLYDSYRLPLGLSAVNGLYELQRSRFAKRWSRPCCNEKGTVLFHNLKVALALNSDMAKKWSDILIAAGATVIKTNLCNVKLDMIIVDSLLLPPHVTAVPSSVSKIIKSVKTDTPIIDLSWATQCIIQRRRIPIDDADRYRPKVGNLGKMDKVIPLHSIKVKSDNMLVRYEVGDPVLFNTGSRKNGHTSIGRINSIHHDRTTKKQSVEVKILELHHDCQLMEGGSNPTIVTIDDTGLQAPIVMLSRRHYEDVNESWKEKIYLQTKP